MLQQLIIQNYALVDFLHLEFNSNMTAISGETGAGKSILLGALGLTLGERAESGTVREGIDKADIHAVFDLHDQAEIKDFLASKHLASNDDPETCILRRIINQDGRSRGYINGKPVNIGTLKTLGQQLLNIHGQHEHQHLLAKESHLGILDRFGTDTALLAEVHEYSQRWHQLAQQTQALTGNQRLSHAEQQLLTYQVAELVDLELQEGELAHLEAEQKRLAQADQLLHAAHTLIPDDTNIDPKATLNQWQQALSPFVEHSLALQNAASMLESALINIDEAQIEANEFINTFDQDPSRLTQVEQRLDTIYTIARKHKLQPTQLAEYHQKLEQQLQQNQSTDEELQMLIEQQQVVASDYHKAAQRLSESRKAAAIHLQTAVAEQLALLGMPHCEIEFTVLPKASEKLAYDGIDDVEMLIKTNLGQAAKPIAKIASGGELSRISLAIQVVIAKTSITPSLIFDEVDVGIGGATAEIVGHLLAQLGQHCQLLCITHLPQVASQAQHHMQVSKQTNNQHTHTHVISLNSEQRVKEIARMLGGVTLTKQTLAHAEEMLGTNALH